MSISNRNQRVLSWLAVLIWMLVIFAASGDSASGNRSSRIIGPIVRFLYPSVTPSELEQVVFVARKGAHVTEYAILAVLLMLAFRVTSVRRPFLMAWVVSALYAATDEWHQSFVPTRAGCWQDVVIDSCGAALGLSLVWMIAKVRAGKRATVPQQS